MRLKPLLTGLEQMTDKDMDKNIREIIEECGPYRKNLLPILNRVQRSEGYLSQEAVKEISKYLDLSENEIYSVASFYSSFSFVPTERPDIAGPQNYSFAARPGEVRAVLRNIGIIDPEKIDDYIARGGYSAVTKTPSEVLEEIAKSAPKDLARKLNSLSSREGNKHLICNTADPSSSIGRVLIENDPHAVVEGMLMAAHASSAGKGLICIDNEYTLAISRLHIALKQAGEHGLLKVPIEIVEVPPALVLGVEEALMSALEGRRAVPSTEIYLGTFIDTAESFARLSALLRAGYAETVIFTIEGDIAPPGIFEVSQGTTLRQIIFDLGGGVTEGRAFKAVQAGGPTGGFLSAAHLEEPLLCSGNLTIVSDHRCAVDLARDALLIVESESCGKCVYCREGTIQMKEILSDILEGRGKPDDLLVLTDLGNAMKDGAFCAFGRKAPDPVLSTIRDFREEYEVHIKEQRCLATRSNS
jgi:NADH:ubiquinone oxidoreductase subunit F (NADH-binding)